MEITSAPSSHSAFRHHLVGRAVGAIDHHAAGRRSERSRGQRALWAKFDCSGPCTPSMRRARPRLALLRQPLAERLVEQLLDLLFRRRRTALKPCGPNSLMPLSSNKLWEAENHHAEIGAHRTWSASQPRASASGRPASTSIPDRGEARHHGRIRSCSRRAWLSLPMTTRWRCSPR